MTKFILIRPNYDEATSMTNAWARDLCKSSQLAADLNAELATEANLRLAMQRHSEVKLIAFYGHGESDNLRAHWDGISPATAVIHTVGPGVLPNELSGYWIYAVACHAGLKLGVSLVAAGCEFIGYRRQFGAPTGFENYAQTVVNTGLLAWLSGKTKSEVFSQLANDWDTLADEFSTGSKCHWVGAFNAALMFLWNRENVCAE